MNRLERAGSPGALGGLRSTIVFTANPQIAEAEIFPGILDKIVSGLRDNPIYCYFNQSTGDKLNEDYCFCRSRVRVSGRPCFC